MDLTEARNEIQPTMIIKADHMLSVIDALQDVISTTKGIFIGIRFNAQIVPGISKSILNGASVNFSVSYNSSTSTVSINSDVSIFSATDIVLITSVTENVFCTSNYISGTQLNIILRDTNGEVITAAQNEGFNIAIYK